MPEASVKLPLKKLILEMTEDQKIDESEQKGGLEMSRTSICCYNLENSNFKLDTKNEKFLVKQVLDFGKVYKIRSRIETLKGIRTLFCDWKTFEAGPGLTLGASHSLIKI